MNINQHPTSTTPNVDIEGVLDTVESNHQRLFEIAETFRQDAPRFLLELSNCIRDGNRAGSILAATKLHDVAVLMRAEPLIEFADTAITLCLQQAWPELISLISTLETTIQGIVNLLRVECVLTETNRLPEPLEFLNDRAE